MNKMKILVTYAGVWKMDNGSSGMTLNYFMYGENGEQMISRVDATGGPVGQQRAKCSLDPSMRQKITFVPGIYDATMGMKIGSDGKPVLTVEDLDFCSRVQILQNKGFGGIPIEIGYCNGHNKKLNAAAFVRFSYFDT